MTLHKAIIIDDEQGSIDSLKWELENFKNQVKVLVSTTDPLQGIEYIKSMKPDIVFLDIEMPAMNGFELLKKIPNISFKTIFTTAYDKFALKAFNVSAYDYLLKPVDEDALARAIEKVSNVRDMQSTNLQLQKLFETLEFQNKPKNISVPTKDGLEFISTEKIIRCESESNYTYIHIDGEKTLFVSKTMKEIENLLDPNIFFRIHNSHVINLNYLRKYMKGKAGSVMLKDGTIIPVSRGRKGGFLEGL